MSIKISNYLLFIFLVRISPPPPRLPPTPPPHTHTHTHTQHKKNLQTWILGQNSLTRELKIRVVGFVLKTLFTYFVDCITCCTLCRWLQICLSPLLTVWLTVLVSMFSPPPPPLLQTHIFFLFRFGFFVKIYLLESSKLEV